MEKQAAGKNLEWLATEARRYRDFWGERGNHSSVITSFAVVL